MFTSKVSKIAIQKLSRNCLLKNLINDGVPYSLFIQNIIEGAGKSSAGERVTFCKSSYLFIGFSYSGDMCLLLFLSYSTYLR